MTGYQQEQGWYVCSHTIIAHPNTVNTHRGWFSGTLYMPNRQFNRSLTLPLSIWTAQSPPKQLLSSSVKPGWTFENLASFIPLRHMIFSLYLGSQEPLPSFWWKYYNLEKRVILQEFCFWTIEKGLRGFQETDAEIASISYVSICVSQKPMHKSLSSKYATIKKW